MHGERVGARRAMETPVTGPLRAPRLIAYSAPSLVTSVAALPMALFVPAFYAADLGVPIAQVGVAIAVSRLLDLVTDPLIGMLSDRTGISFGRRRSFMVLGAPLFLVSLWQIFVPGESASALHLLIWSALLYLGFTMIDLPHKAWGAELSGDYDERSRITSWREAISTAGQVLLLAALVVMASRGIDAAAPQLRSIATAIVVLLPILLLVCVLTVPDRTPPGARQAKLELGRAIAEVARNPAFVRMVGCVLLFVSGVAIQGTLHRLVLADVMGDEARFPLMLLLENVATLALVPVWLRLSIRIGKHRALMAAALWLALFSLPLMLIREGDTPLLIALIVVRGSSFASILFIAHSMAADAIDVGTLESGEQRSGLFFAAWGMVTKLALALGVLLGTQLPAAAGYVPREVAADPAIATRLMVIYGGVPALLMAAGALFLYRFPITRERQAELRAAIDEKLERATPRP